MKDAVQLLKGDHCEAEALFKDHEQAKESNNNKEKMRIAKEVFDALLIKCSRKTIFTVKH